MSSQILCLSPLEILWLIAVNFLVELPFDVRLQELLMHSGLQSLIRCVVYKNLPHFSDLPLLLS
ncbi:rCG63282 [Rattus norvegicus]|uniref:RCG63282 n=1 Tax=Rattus norvegicus TaxID=10116 RepID=A6J4H9_RAT|nr:rCG63282 [Rattus norvegicus]